MVEVGPAFVVDGDRGPGADQLAQLDGLAGGHAVADRPGDREAHAGVAAQPAGAGGGGGGEDGASRREQDPAGAVEVVAVVVVVEQPPTSSRAVGPPIWVMRVSSLRWA